MTKLFGDDSDEAWRWFGAHDPYYGVLSGAEYHKHHLTSEHLEAFFASGANHVAHVLQAISAHLGDLALDRCLDFGCGVGRLVIPFASKFAEVVGVDISDGMIAEARRNCQRTGTRNVEFRHSLDEIEGSFDLVHSYIVLQHIPISRGVAIIDRLIDFTRPQGVCYLHLSIGRNAGALRDIATFVRKNVKPVHWALNVLEKKPTWRTSYMQANRYDLNSLLARLYERNIRQMWLEAERHGSGPYSVSLLFRVPR
jgi:SAM-dependent methyltransferase